MKILIEENKPLPSRSRAATPEMIKIAQSFDILKKDQSLFIPRDELKSYKDIQGAATSIRQAIKKLSTSKGVKPIVRFADDGVRVWKAIDV